MILRVSLFEVSFRRQSIDPPITGGFRAPSCVLPNAADETAGSRFTPNRSRHIGRRAWSAARLDRLSARTMSGVAFDLDLNDHREWCESEFVHAVVR
jgi:hypothetical protein